jgi:macrolide transport system ATP-binding/permease protein
MKRLHACFSRLAGLFNKERRYRELAEEIERHLQLHIDDDLLSRMKHGEARRQTQIKLGGSEQAEEAYPIAAAF